MAILKLTGDWQKHKGPPAPEPLEGRRAEEGPSLLLERRFGHGRRAQGEAITQKKEVLRERTRAAGAASGVDRGSEHAPRALGRHLVKGIVDNPDDVQVAARNLRRGARAGRSGST